MHLCSFHFRKDYVAVKFCFAVKTKIFWVCRSGTYSQCGTTEENVQRRRAVLWYLEAQKTRSVRGIWERGHVSA